MQHGILVTSTSLCYSDCHIWNLLLLDRIHHCYTHTHIICSLALCFVQSNFFHFIVTSLLAGIIVFKFHYVFIFVSIAAAIRPSVFLFKLSACSRFFWLLSSCNTPWSQPVSFKFIWLHLWVLLAPTLHELSSSLLVFSTLTVKLSSQHHNLDCMTPMTTILQGLKAHIPTLMVWSGKMKPCNMKMCCFQKRSSEWKVN